MVHVVRAWRASRTIRVFILIVLLGTATQVVLSRGAGSAQPVQTQARQPQRFGSERLVSVEPLSQDDGQICVTDPDLIASLQPEAAFIPRQQSGSRRSQEATDQYAPGSA